MVQPPATPDVVRLQCELVIHQPCSHVVPTRRALEHPTQHATRLPEHPRYFTWTPGAAEAISEGAAIEVEVLHAFALNLGPDPQPMTGGNSARAAGNAAFRDPARG